MGKMENFRQGNRQAGQESDQSLHSDSQPNNLSGNREKLGADNQSYEKAGALPPFRLAIAKEDLSPSAPEVGNAEHKVFKLGASSEQIAWYDWQKRLNQNIQDKMQSLVHGHNFPSGLECKIKYSIDDDGYPRHSMVSSSGNPEYDKVINRAIDETLKYHPELLVFPKGSHKNQHQREATFSFGGANNYATNRVDDELYKM